MRKLSFIIVSLILTLPVWGQSPHGGSLNIDCSSCHTSQGWKVSPSAMQFKHESTGFILEGEHKSVDCVSCHNTLVFSEAKPECSSCHNDVHENTVGLDCARCHTPNTWVVTDITNMHNMGRFPLLGPHTKADCQRCHNTPGSKVNFEALGTACFDCHKQKYFAAKNPDHIAANFSKDCETCHSPDANIWNLSSVNHDFFPLVDGHATSCYNCHKGGDFGEVDKNCFSCHSADYAATSNPNHSQLNFPQDCQQCHSLKRGWSPVNFNHDSFYPILGAHQKIKNDCTKCHTTPTYSEAPTDCYGCHSDNFNATTSPNHVQSNFSKDCLTCHSQDAWTPATFDHDAIYQLLGAHNDIRNDCQKCHADGYAGTATDCYSCHVDNYNATTNPSHSQLSFSTDCQTCHTQDAWTPATFDHDNQFFPIYSGKHNGAWNVCSDCHTDQNNYAVFSCFTCHQHNQSDTDSEHGGVNGYVYESNACLSCHPTGGGEGDGDSPFNHASTAFPLAGSHVGISCTDCHISGFTGTSADCSSCHKDSFNAAADPNHQSLSLSQNCSDCHNVDSWKPSTFTHATATFQLTGKHVQTACADCHTTSVSNTPSLCYDCHTSKFTNAPDHVSQGYPHNCETCHNTNAWQPADFDHSKTSFPLTGSHLDTDCASCHTSGYTGTSSTCVDCHKSNFDNSANPNHTTLNIPTDCERCHTTAAGWKPADFPIHDQYFQLLGAHSAISGQCDKCHTTAVYADAPVECIGCHQTNYQNTTNPNHAAANFPQTCQDCHSNSAWKPATFDHDNKYFPIYSGEHNNKWNSCSDCHNNSSDYGVFTCFTCHLQGDMNSEHNGVNGYSYDNNACLTCHPTGGGEGGGDDGGIPRKINKIK